MIRKPKYKICRRLGSGVYEKCQNQKFVLSEAKHAKRSHKRPKPISDYGLQLLEKQKVRLSYGITEKQLSRYVKQSLHAKINSALKLYEELETRLDNVVFRLGLASSRAWARQMVSHGHIVVNGKRVTVPSYCVKIDDVLKIKEGNKVRVPFQDLDKKLKNYKFPEWLVFDISKKEGIVKGKPKYSETFFDLNAIFSFYSR